MFYLNSSLMLAFRQQLLSLVDDLNRPRTDPLKPSSESWHGLRPRQQTPYVSTCGYLDGDPDKSRTADPGFDCRVDTVHALWGFCSTTVISASDCGLAAECVDTFACSSGCGIPKVTGLTTFTCSGSENGYCSTALLEAGPDQTYSYIACGPTAKTDHLFAAATTPPTTSASSNFSIPTKATPSSSIGIPTSTTTNPSPFSTVTSSLKSSITSVASSSTTSEVSSLTTAPSDVSKSSANNTGAIVGGIIGGLAFIVLVGFAIFFLRLYSRRHPKPSLQQILWDHDAPKNPSSNNTRLAELSGTSRFPHELPGEGERVPIELDGLSRRSVHDTECS